MSNNIIGQVLGGERKVFDVDTVGELRSKMGLDSSYGANVNGDPEGDDYELDNSDIVVFTKNVKGGF